MNGIKDIKAIEILDSRGNPTIEVDVILECGSKGNFKVPSGASTGEYEAYELRDGDKNRYNGKGVLKAVDNVNGQIFDALCGLNPFNQLEIDNALMFLDGTDNKSNLGANAILGVSIACAKAAASSLNISFYSYIGGIFGNCLPVPMMNIINGGEHANNNIDIQEFMIMPVGGKDFKHSLQIGTEIFQKLKENLDKKGLSTAVGDEGGFTPELNSSVEALDLIVASTSGAGYEVGNDVVFAIDCASSEYFKNEKYNLKGEGKSLTSKENLDYLQELCNNYPIYSIEDGMDENDWEGWSLLTKTLGKKVQLVGDDLFATNYNLLSKGINENIGNSILIKPNQNGTLSGTLDVIFKAQKSGYNCVMSHRSGETEDTTIADLAVATNCGQIKTGSLSRSDRTAKYNRLLKIEEELAENAKYLGKNIAKR